MSSDIRIDRVRDLLSAGVLWVEDGNHGENRPLSDEFASEGTPFIRPDDLAHGVVDFANCDRINAKALNRVRKGRGRAGDIAFTHRATVGRIARVGKSAPDFVANPGVTLWRVLNRATLDADYLYYFMQTPFFMNQVWAEAGNTDTFPYISLTQQRGLAIRYPSLAVQRRLGSALSVLDDRITLLRETNVTLEAIAQALFKSWFVDFDPVRAKSRGLTPAGMDEATAALFPEGFEESAQGLVPKGWQVATLAEAFEINPSRGLRKGEEAKYLEMAGVPTTGHCADSIAVRAFGSGTKFRNGDTLLARITPCLENGKTAFVDFLEGDEIGWGSTEFIVLRPRAPLPEYFAYLLCRHAPFREFAERSMSGTSGRQRVQNDVLATYRVAVPPAAVAKAFGAVVRPLQDAITSNHARAATLGELRDTLLPRLISGQLRLPPADEVIAEATHAD